MQALLLHETPLQAMPSDAAYRTAEGGLEYLVLHKTRNLRKALVALDPYYRTVATTLLPDASPLQGLPRDRRWRWCWAMRSGACPMTRWRDAAAGCASSGPARCRA